MSAALIKEAIPTSVIGEVHIEPANLKDAHDRVIATFTNSGQETENCRCEVIPPEGRIFHGSSIGITGSAAYDWEQLSSKQPGSWRFEVLGLKSGARATIEMPLALATN